MFVREHYITGVTMDVAELERQLDETIVNELEEKMRPKAPAGQGGSGGAPGQPGGNGANGALKLTFM